MDCGELGCYGVDPFGIPTETWRCRLCYEQACRRIVRDDYHIRYGRR
jgi:hypothetical protein